MLAQCAAFTPGPSEYTEAGTNRHRLFSAMIERRLGKITKETFDAVTFDFEEEDIAACEWATDYFMLHAQHGEYPVELEKTRTGYLPDFTELEGTPDATCHRDLFDLKSRPRNYREQMAGYVVLMCEGNPALKVVNVHLLFTVTQKHERYSLTHEEALEIVESVRNKPKVPTPCDYCNWCANQVHCPAIINQVKTVAAGYDDQKQIIDIDNWHPSQMTDAREIATGLSIAKRLVGWCESMKYHALNAAIKQGLSIPGYELRPRKGKTFCTDATAAFGIAHQSGMTQDDFMAACTLALNDSKTTGMTGLVTRYATLKGLKKAPAKKELLTKLAPVLKTTPDTQSLKAVGENDSDE